MNQKDIYLELSNKLFEVFYVDDKKYGRQQEDSTYKLVKEKISPVTIEDMLRKQKSLLTYQELHIVGNALIKWICIDLDINKKEIDSNEVNKENLELVKEASNEVCDFLDSINVPYLLEFSGRRGFHIWIIFDRLITKENGFRFINFIISKVKDKFDKIIIADKFPKTAYVNPKTKGVGFGIKLPLSQNKGNGKLSFFLNKNDSFEYDQDKWLSKPNHDFLVKQFSILSSLELVSLNQIQPFIEEYNKSLNPKNTSEKFLKNKRVNTFLPDNIDLETILLSLRKCEHLDNLLFEYEKSLGGKERGILVGLLGQLKTKDDSDFGHKILMELFSNIQDFKPEKTEKNLNNLKYFQPITCSNFGKCKSCEQCKLTSPVELIDNIELIDKPSYSIKNLDDNLFENLKNSIYQYSLKNDEVPLYPQLRKSSSLTLAEIEKNIANIYKGDYPIFFDSYSFKRNELTKVRTLYNLDTTNNFISTYFTFVLNTIYYTEISNNSYGYQFNGHLAQNNIFNNWFVNWAKFSREIEKVLFSEEYEDFYVLKLDIKSFYDKIDLKRLKIKLYEEAPSSIKEKLNDLSEDDRVKYKHIINYLVDLSVKTTKSEIGLPQGPAYARYLAELYLNGLDTLIEKTFITDQRREFYNRFVDDIFIFVESKERADILYSKIKEWLSINNLELNSEKSRVLNVKEYAESGDYNRYKDNIKYDINFVNKNKNVLSEEEIQKAISDLEDLTNDEKFGLKDNLRFFYNQFKGDKRLNFLRTKLSKRLPFSNDGRGALYMLFYTDLIANFSDTFWSLAHEVDKIKGLSLTHYLNTILLNEDLINENLISINILIENCIKKTNISDADKLLIASICVKCNLNFKLNYSREIMNSALEIPNMKYTIELWDIMHTKLEEFQDKEGFLKEIDRIINNNTYDIVFLNKLSEYSFRRFSEWKIEEILSHEILISYYHCICFLTLFEISETNVNLVSSWKLLLEKSVIYGKIHEIDYQFLWLSKLSDFKYTDFSNSSYSILLNDKSGSPLGTYKCINGFLSQYKNVLLMLLFAKDKINNFKDFRDNIAKYIDDKDSLFYGWVTRNDVLLYPQEDDVCLKNIALNGIIVLTRGEEVFIKSINEPLINKYTYINFIQKNPNVSEIEFKFSGNNLVNILKGNSIVDVLYNLSEIIKDNEKFKQTYGVKYPLFYKPYDSFEKNPSIPFYSDFQKIVNNEGIIVDNTLETYLENLNFILKSSEINSKKLVEEESDYNFTIDDLPSRFFPNSKILIGSADSKLNFILEFVNQMDKNEINSIFQFQYYWSLTIYNLLKKSKEDTLLNFLKIHFDMFDDKRKREDIDIFFSVNDGIIINDKTLESFYKTIKNSIEIFQSEVSSLTYDFKDFIDENVPNLYFENETIQRYDIDNSSFEKTDIEIIIEQNYSTKEDVFKLKVDNTIFNGIENVYLFEHEIKVFRSLSLKDLVQVLNNKRKKYSYKNSDGIFIYFPELEIVNAFERIEVRKKIYDFAQNNSEEGDIRLKRLFPYNKSFMLAEKVYNSFTSKAEIEKKLSIHYTNTIDIKDRVVNWLSSINNDSIIGSNLEKYMASKNIELPFLYHSILNLINAHKCYDDDDLSYFKNKINDYKSNENYILFPIKDPFSDSNGLGRLLRKCNFEDRDINFTKYRDIVYNNDCTNKILVVITDISISGAQTTKAFDYYTRCFSEGQISSDIQDRAIREKYFTYKNESEFDTFNLNINRFEKIIFLSPLMTELYEIKVKEIFKEAYFETNKNKLKLSEYLFGKYPFNVIELELIKELIQDTELLKKIFLIDSAKLEHYQDNHIKKNNLEKRNLLMRVGSLPALHLWLLTLQPKKGDKLLDYVGNWEY